MELFDKRFVHFMWNPALKGKRGFLSSGIDTLIKMVNEDSDRTEIQKGCERDLPFCKHITVECRLAYYDPNYECKKAFNEGKKIQFLSRQQQSNGEWIDVWYDCVGPNEPKFLETVKYRVKPEEEKKYRPYESSAEMIMDFIDRFNADCPIYREPSIWVKNKWSGGRFLITGIESSPYDGENVEVQCGLHCVSGLFDTYTYLDGSPCGMEVKE